MSAFNSLLNPLVRRYLRWKQGDEEDQWSNKAQEALIKKLKREGQFENLQAALSMKKEHGPCVKIGRSQDGRLQVSHKKMLPHVMYCRVFRWPDLQSQHELRSVSTCHWPAHKRELTMVCINPYHYVRVDHSIFPAVVAVRNDSQQQQQQQQQPQQQHDASPPSAGGSYPSQQSSPYVTPPPQNTGYLQPTAIASNTWYGAPFPAYGDPAPMEIAYDIKPMNSWCRISYYELNQRVGDAFKSDARTVTIDGGTDPEATTSGRFCLGALSNPSRRKAISDIRSLIGPGITLEQDNGQIHVKNLSDHPVFFNSRIHNMENQLHPHTVVRVSPGVRMKMFDHNIFAGLLDQTYNSQDIKKYEQIYSLIDYCIIKLGFVKGWGAMYHRQDATSTPCWTEIQLLKELGMIEQCLKQIGRPTASQVTSTS